MMRHLFFVCGWFSLRSATSATTLPSEPPPCTNDADCAYAGTCGSNGVCYCRKGYTGLRCSQLDLAPMELNSGLHLPHNWTWGGSVIRGDDGKYHMFVMHLVKHCGIQCYQTNGQVLHAISSTAQGPFAVQGVAISPRPGKWDGDTISEPAIYRASDGTYLLYHMGLNDTHTAFDCMAHDTNCRGIGGKRKIGVAFSQHLEGPWERLDSPILEANPKAGTCDAHDVSNPAVAFTPNGSVIMAYKGEGGCNSGVIGIATAAHWRGPYTRPLPITPGSGAQKMGERACEDPYIWYDKNAPGGGVYRMISHACIAGVNVQGQGGHLFSKDGLDWQEAWNDDVLWAYDSTVTWANGTRTEFYRRERPQVLLDEHGDLACLYNSAQPSKGAWGDACHSYTTAQCVKAAAPPTPPPAVGCKSDLDCSLNGRCSDRGRCDCDAAWTGAQCEVFATLPVPAGSDIKEPNITTWGGGPLQHKVDGKFHIYASEMLGSCGITTWQTNSQVVHFTASAPTGPWERSNVTVPVWSHCPSAAVSPNGTVVLWSFAGNLKPKTGKDAWGKECIGGASPCGFAKHGCGPGAPPPPSPPPALSLNADVSARPTLKMTKTSALPLRVSTSGVAGPWKTVLAMINEEVGYSIAAPWILENGTSFWVLQAACPEWVCPLSAGKCPGTCGTIIRAEAWEGPYEVIARGACAIGEDHSIYVDKRGVHCLTHRFSNSSLPAGPYDATKDGGHSFSLDGHDPWYCADGKGGHEYCNLNSPIAYNSTVIYEANGVNKFGTRERPHIMFDGDTPVALTTSVQHCQAPDIPDACTSDPRSCNQTNIPCRNAWPGYKDRAFTSIVPLRTKK